MFKTDGGKGSGNWGHSGIPGKRGGSQAGGGYSKATPATVGDKYTGAIKGYFTAAKDGQQYAIYNGKRHLVSWFSNNDGIQVSGPKDCQKYIDKYKKEQWTQVGLRQKHTGALKTLDQEALQYNNVKKDVANFEKIVKDKYPGDKYHDGTYDAVTKEKINLTKGYCVTFHQNNAANDPLGGYTDKQYAQMCAISKQALGAKSVNIGYFGNAEVSFVCDSHQKAIQFAIAHNQQSIYNNARGTVEVNPFYNPETNPIGGHA